MKKFLNIAYEAHNAVSDVKALQDLFDLKMCSKWTVADVFCFNFHACKKSYDSLFNKKVINKLSIEKLSKNGISFSHLKLAHKRDAVSGLKFILRESKIQLCYITSILGYIQKEE